MKKRVRGSSSSNSNNNNNKCTIARIGIGVLFAFNFVIYLVGLMELMISLPEMSDNIVPTKDVYGQNLNSARYQLLKMRNKFSKKISSISNKHQQQQHKKHHHRRGVDWAVPRGVWPIPSVMNSTTDALETIIHPGDLKTKMQVPKLWSLPIHNNTLMTHELAMQVGICTKPDEDGNYVRNDDDDPCPLKHRTIFVAIASYRDFRCRSTVESIFQRAKYPHRLRVAIVDQIIDGMDPVCNVPIEPCEIQPQQALCKHRNQVDIFIMDAKYSVGPVFARHLGHRMYRGEYYATQSDAHVTYVQDWDVDIIQQLESTRNEMAVLSTYLSDIKGAIDKRTGKSKIDTRPIMCNSEFEQGSGSVFLVHQSQPEGDPSITGMPQLQPWWAAGYSFSRGHFVTNVLYDPYLPFIFQGEEMSIAIRGFTIGYDFYTPERSVCFHHYHVPKDHQVTRFWENMDYFPDSERLEEEAMARLLGIVQMNPEVDPVSWNHVEEHIYGIGKARPVQQFYDIFGIDVVNKYMEKHLCRFVDVGAKMHHLFVPRLRHDHMGIDYSNITFRFVDPTPNERDFYEDP